MKKIIIVITALSLFACSVKQPPVQDEITESSLPETTKVPLDYSAAAGNAKGEVIDGWLSTFGDAGLEAIVSEAIQNNLNLRAAVAKVDAASAYAVQAGAELKPAIAAGGQGLERQGFSSGDPQLTSSGAALNLSWELDLWGRVRSQAQAGQAAFESSQYQLEWIYQSIAAQAAKTWFLVTEAKLQLELAEQALELFNSTKKIVEAKYKQGQLTAREVALAKARVATGEVTVRQAQAAKRQAARALETILGRYPEAKIEGAKSFVAVPPPIPAGLPSQLLERRPDIQAAERAIAAQFLTIETAKAARLPKISLTAAAGTSENELAGLLSFGSDYWSAGANFAAPIYTGGALKAQVDIEKAKYEEAIANYGSLALRAFSEVEQGLDNERFLREREHYLNEVVVEASEALRVANAQFDAGKVDLLSVLQQQAQVVSAKVSALNIRSQRLQRRVDFHMALGGGFSEQ